MYAGVSLDRNIDSEAVLRLLAASRLFGDLAALELGAVVEAGQRVRTARKEFFFHQGDPARALYVLLEGQAKLTQMTPDGNQVLLRFLGPGEMMGVVAALGEMVYPATAQAAVDCVSLCWPGEAMARLMEQHPRVAMSGMRMLAARVRELQDRVWELATERVERRVARAVLRLAQHAGQKTEDGVLVSLPLSREDLGEMTGTTLYTVSRILSNWEQQGLVKAGRGKLLIRFPHGLVSIAEDLPADAADSIQQ